MTFKHINFGDSVTMRSLERVVQEKGWFKDAPIEKTASSKTQSLIPSSNLIENIVKLCSGLRASGFDKYADELELAFVTYKKADKTYDVSNEKGEDLIDAAHPEGGHQMEGVEGDAYVETVLEKHLKMLDVSNKEPKAKLSSSQDILKAVKRVLAQSAVSVTATIADAYKDLFSVYRMAQQSGGLTPPVLSWLEGRVESVAKLARTPEDQLSVDGLGEAMNTIDAIARNLHPNALHNWLPEFLNKGISTDVLWNKINQRLDSSKAKLQRAAEKLADIQSQEPSEKPAGETKPTQLKEVDVEADPTISKAIQLINRLNAYKAIGSVARNASATKWINDEIVEIKDLMKRVSSVPEGQEATVGPALAKELAEKEQEVKQFADAWT